ncbi:sirohydrochlorin ferrochelatase [Streptomyces sp. SLBN-118]|uniref:sirohydrochlorin chelatase n=1 Tax=Streptomyces sp. SLBN-118 TaxID=2768454 RepID=UPI00114E8F89|nr:sirohydrochlorin chelatase [Streptomyces sp. SLBN-118]TQK44473.1 sirohydrochlorin ferrochelatase [Streptomyces sp. SLBN-118]
MTEPAVHPRESLPLDAKPLDAGLFDSTPLATTAQLLSRITDQLGTQLSHVTRNGARRRMPPTERPTLVAVAHGSRDPRALRTATALLDVVRELRPSLDVRLGHIELNEPLLSDTLAALHAERHGQGTRAVLVPLLLGRGHHVKHDLPQAAAALPDADIRIAAPLGPHPLLLEALCSRLADAGWRPEDGTGRSAGVVLAAAGSRDPDSASDTRRTADLLSERLGGVPVVPAYASAASPTVPAAIRALTARGRHRIAVASYFVCPGQFSTASASASPWIAAEPLGAHPALARLLLRRYEEALSTPRHAAQRRELATA